jgi:4-hydroxyphenylpyruvate dioxygenase-like putative hemolysin
MGKGDSFAISALVRKRAAYSGELPTINRERRKVMDAIDKVDAVLVALGYKEAIKPRKKQVRLFKRGRLKRMVADLRRERPDMTAHCDIACEVVKRLGWNVDDRELLECVAGKVRLVSNATTKREGKNRAWWRVG